MTIKELRKKYNLTQTDLCLKCKVSLSTIQFWERGISNPTDERKERLIDLFAEYGEKYEG